MNRIAKLRELKGLSQAELARRVRQPATQSQIQRLESGERRLTEDWMRRIAPALDVEPPDLLETATRAEFGEDEFEAYLPEASDDLARPLKARNLRYLRVKRPSLELIGLPRGKVILVDQSKQATKHPRTGDVLQLELTFPDGNKARVLRQFLAPALATTNRRGRNTSFSLEGEDFSVAVVGVMVPEDEPAAG